MAHFAKISLDKKVLQVLTVNDSDTMDVNGQENEVIGQKYLEKHNNWPAHLWVKTSYNTTANKHLQNKTPYRGNYAGIGDEWDEENQIFWKQKPHLSWVKDIASASWKSPKGDAPELTNEQKAENEIRVTQSKMKILYMWNEENQDWVLQNE